MIHSKQEFHGTRCVIILGKLLCDCRLKQPGQKAHVQLPIHLLSPALEVAGVLLESVRVGVGWNKWPVQWYIIITIYCAF